MGRRTRIHGHARGVAPAERERAERGVDDHAARFGDVDHVQYRRRVDLRGVRVLRAAPVMARFAALGGLDGRAIRRSDVRDARAIALREHKRVRERSRGAPPADLAHKAGCEFGLGDEGAATAAP